MRSGVLYVMSDASTPLIFSTKNVRIITFSHYLAHTQPLFIDLFVLPLDKLILNRIGIIMYKICNGLLPEVRHVLHVRNKDIHSYNTRSRNLLIVPKGSTIFVNISTQLWNVLLLNIDVNVSITIFNPFATRSRSQPVGYSLHGTRSRCERLAYLSRTILIIFQIKT